MRVTLKQIQVFDAVARFGGIGRAGEEIGLSQSAVSVALKELENGLGVPLFERHKRKLVLNENGKRFQPRARSVLRQVSDLEGAVLSPQLRGTLRIASSSTVGTYLLPTICAQFAVDHPEVILKLTVGSSTDVVDAIDRMKQDVGFIEATSLRTSLEVTPWRQDEMVMFCAPGHPLAREPFDAERLKREAWALQPLGSFTRYAFTSFVANRLHIHHLEVAFESNSLEALKSVVKAGRAVGCLSRLAVKDELARGELVACGPPDMPIMRPFNIIVRRDLYHGEMIDAFLRAVSDAEK